MSEVTILDGGMGHELRRMGAPFSRPLWSAEALIKAPEMVVQAHTAYINAGADIITTNSYACVPFHLGEELFRERGTELAALAGKLAREAADEAERKIRVAGSLPPVMGSYRPDFFDGTIAQPITQALYTALEPYVDLWLAETMSSLAEFQSTAEVLKQADKPVYFSFTLDDDSQPPKLRSGESITQLGDAVSQTNATGLMFNCSIPEIMAAALHEATQRQQQVGSHLQLGVYANKFTPIKSTQDSRSQEIEMREIEPEGYVEFAKEWQQLGAGIIGGCCGIGPEHISVLNQWRLKREAN